MQVANLVPLALCIGLIFIPAKAQSQNANISGSGNLCSVASTGTGNNVTVSCVGVDPALVERLLQENNLRSTDTQEMTKQINLLVQRFKTLRDDLEGIRIDNSSTKRAWEAL